MSDPIITCPGCGKQYKWTPKVAGMSAPCRCGETIAMPNEAPVDAPAPAPAAPPSEDDDGIIPLEDNPLLSLDTPIASPPPEAPPQQPSGALDLSADIDITGGGEASDAPAEDDYGLAGDPPGGAAAPAVAGGACPNCAAQLAEGAIICVNCGYNINTGKIMGGAVVAETDEDDDSPYADMTEEERKKHLMEEYYIPAGLLAVGFALGLIAGTMRTAGSEFASFSFFGYSIIFTISTVFGVFAMVCACFLAANFVDISFGNLSSAVVKLAAVYTLPSSLSEFITAVIGPDWGFMVNIAVLIGGYYGLMMWFFGIDFFEAMIVAVISWFVNIGLAILMGIIIAALFVGAMSSGALDVGDYESDLPVAVTVDPVIITKADTPFQITVGVSNTSNSAQTLYGIEFDDEFLSVVEVTKSTPAWSDKSSIDEGYTTHLFKTPIPPGESVTVVFDATAKRKGSIEGYVTTYINGTDLADEHYVAVNVQ